MLGKLGNTHFKQFVKGLDGTLEMWIYQLTLVIRRQEEVVEVQEDQLEKTCLGKFMEKLDHFNRC